MSDIDNKFEKIKKYLIKIENNVDKDFFEFQIGLPQKWYYKSNEFISCEDLKKIEDYGTIVNVFPKKEDVTVNDIINFIIKTIETNNRISEMEKAFEEKMESEKKKIKNEVEEFYSKIEDLREKSFQNLDDEDTVNDNLEKIKNIAEDTTTEEKNNKKDDEENHSNDLKNINDTKKNIYNIADSNDESVTKKKKDGIDKGTKNK